MASLVARKMKSPCSVVFAMNPNPKLAFSFTINVTPIARLVWPKIEKSQKIWKKRKMSGFCSSFVGTFIGSQ